MVDTGLVEALFVQYPGAVVVLDPSFRYIRFNAFHDQTVRTLGGKAPKVGDPILDAFPAGSPRDRARETLDRARSGETFSIDSSLDLGHSGPRFFRISFLPVREPGGAVDRLLVLAQDTTETVRDREALSRGDQRLKEALEAGETGYWTYEPAANEVFFSEGFYTMLGYDPRDFPMSLDGWTDLVHPDDAKGTLRNLRVGVRSGSGSFQVEYRMKTATGGWRWIQSRGRVVAQNDAGDPLRIAGTSLDITRRKLTERALAESEARWTSLVDEAPVGISLIGPGGQVLFENSYEAARKEFPALGRNWREFLAGDLHQTMGRALDLAFEEGTPSVFQTYRILADGTTEHFENHASPVREEGVVKACLVLSIDVTAQYRQAARRAKDNLRMETLLALHTNRLVGPRALFDTAVNAAVALTDSHLGFLDFYSEDTRLFSRQSWSPEPPVSGGGPGPESSYPLESAGLWAEAVRQRKPVIVNDLAASSTPNQVFPGGRGTLRRVLSLPVFENEKIVAVIRVGNKVLPYDQDDVDQLRILTDSLWQFLGRMAAEEALDRLYQAVEHSPVSIVITDPSGLVEYANPRFSAGTGRSFDEVLGAVPEFLDPGRVPGPVLGDLWATVRAGREWRGELEDRTSEGRVRTDLVSVSPVFGPEGDISHIIAVNEDITDRKEAQVLLARAQRMELVGQLAAGVAHDFNNLLTSVLGYNEMLLRKIEIANPLRVYAEKIDQSGRRAADLVAGLLAVGRQQRLSKDRVDLTALLGAEKLLLASLVRGDLQLRMDLPAEPLWVEVDPGQVGQVVVNLVSNARDAATGPGTIEVSAGQGGGPDPGAWAWFQVADDGPGIPKELQEKVFDPFFTTKPIGQGTGLGLSIVQGIVQQHQGRITLESTPGRGTRFTVWLPLLGREPGTGG